MSEGVRCPGNLWQWEQEQSKAADLWGGCLLSCSCHSNSHMLKHPFWRIPLPVWEDLGLKLLTHGLRTFIWNRTYKVYYIPDEVIVVSEETWGFSQSSDTQFGWCSHYSLEWKSNGMLDQILPVWTLCTWILQSAMVYWTTPRDEVAPEMPRAMMKTKNEADWAKGRAYIKT